MRVLVYMGHPAHFYLYKNVIENLRAKNNEVDILIKKKDILQNLLNNQGWKYNNILEEGRKGSKFSMFYAMLKRSWRLLKFCNVNRPDLLTGTSVENSYIGPLKNIPVINCNEDDAKVVPLYAKLSYPGASVVLSPIVCENGKWEEKSVKYPSYQELAYLHPNHFTADKTVVEKYFSADKPYFILRFAKLNAHHDEGIQGINTEVAQRLIDILKPHGDIYITSERELEPQFEQYRIKINPLDMHHVMAFASLYIGDSQTMAAEAAVLGTPFVRFNDFVGRIGYLRELEDDYQLGYGIKASEEGSVERLCNAVSELANLSSAERKERYQTRRQKMLSEKIDYAKFLTWFIENYPDSKELSKNEDKEFWERFR